jgi:hypothetical protein
MEGVWKKWKLVGRPDISIDFSFRMALIAWPLASASKPKREGT